MRWKVVRSFSLQGLAFRGEEVEPPRLRLRGLELSSLPVGVKSLPASIHSVILDEVSHEKNIVLFKS
ncbi:hypothetical protein [Rossellomorea marisflavi]|uniref:hypothetical protein n=1 Tax=Rossellomorea marisflavi TaxID=189381 RepID=UPI00345A0288